MLTLANAPSFLLIFQSLAPAAKYTSSTEYPCVYPLSYGGDVYCDCIQGITEVWCATSTDSNNEYVSWNSCKEAGKTIILGTNWDNFGGYFFCGKEGALVPTGIPGPNIPSSQ